MQKIFVGISVGLTVLIILLNAGCIPQVSQALVQTEGFDFRRTRWGYTQGMVTVAEQGKRLFLRKGNVLMFNHKIGEIPCKVIYCFKDNRLRAAGYITLKPVRGAQSIIEHCVEQNGEPTQILNDGMLWFTDRSLYYVNAYVSRVQSTPAPYAWSGGILSHLLEPKQTPGTIKLWDGVWAHIDRSFYEDLHHDRFPLDKLSFYEKQLFGVLKRQPISTFYVGQTQTTLPGNTVPEGAQGMLR